MGGIASQITSLAIVYSAVYSDTDQRKQWKLRVTGLCVGNPPGQVNSPHKGPVTRKMFPFDNVIMMLATFVLTHWLRPSEAYASLVQIDNGLSPGRCQAIIVNNAAILLIGSLGMKSNETLFEIHKFSLKKIHSKLSSGKRRPSCLGFNVLTKLMMTHPVNWRICWV